MTRGTFGCRPLAALWFAEALLEGTVSPADVQRDWPEWFGITEAFVAAYEFDDLETLAQAADIQYGTVHLSEADRHYLDLLIVLVDTYAAAREQGEEF